MRKIIKCKSHSRGADIRKPKLILSPLWIWLLFDESCSNASQQGFELHKNIWLIFWFSFLCALFGASLCGKIRVFLVVVVLRFEIIINFLAFLFVSEPQRQICTQSSPAQLGTAMHCTEQHIIIIIISIVWSIELFEFYCSHSCISVGASFVADPHLVLAVLLVPASKLFHFCFIVSLNALNSLFLYFVHFARFTLRLFILILFYYGLISLCSRCLFSFCCCCCCCRCFSFFLFLHQ